MPHRPVRSITAKLAPQSRVSPSSRPRRLEACGAARDHDVDGFCLVHEAVAVTARANFGRCRDRPLRRAPPARCRTSRRKHTQGPVPWLARELAHVDPVRCARARFSPYLGVRVCRVLYRRTRHIRATPIRARVRDHLFANELIDALRHADLLAFSDRLALWKQWQATRSCYYPLFVSELPCSISISTSSIISFPRYHGSGFAKHGR